MWVTSSTANVLKPSAIALGNFDGIHRGHRQVLQPILEACLAKRSQADQNHATVVTFNPHPRQFFTGQKRQLLTPLEEKVKELERLGIEQLVLLPFNKDLAALSPQQFVEKILVQQLQASLVSVGQDFRFGRDRTGTADELKRIAAQFGVEVNITSLKICQSASEQVRISSSLIRQALEQGDVSTANTMLGRAYTITGTIVVGQKLGRTIGFPTANIMLPPEKFLPRYGVYAVRAFVDELEQSNNTSSHAQCPMPHTQPPNAPIPIIGVMNLGCRPTVGGNAPTAEVHLLDWSGDLYGRTLTVSLEKFIRPEQKFSSLEALKAQITSDCETARENLNSKV